MSMCKPNRKPGCNPQTGSIPTFGAIVRSYITDYRQRTRDTLGKFKSCPSLADAIPKVTWSDKTGHQRLVNREALTDFTKKLVEQESTLKGSSFDHLYQQVEAQRVHGIGDLTIYDTALGIGSFLGCLPSRVYLHRGTREGARALAALGKVNPSAESIALTDLPPAFRKLQAHEVEDCLCLYKKAIRRIVSRMVSR